LKKTTLVLALGVCFVSSAIRAERPAADPELAKGREQVRSGEYDAGIATLTAVVRRLHGVPDRDAEAADAYLHLGIAYAGLGQISPAKSQFVQALKRDPSVEPDPKTTPPAALEAFAAARREGESEGVVSKDRQAKKKKKGAGTKILLAAGVVGGGAAVAVAASGGGSSPSPSPAAAFIPISTSPYIELVRALPGPGSQFPSSVSVSLTVRSQNVGTAEIQFLFVADAVTSDGRACLSGRSARLSFAPGGIITGTFVLSSKCTAPFTTESLEIAMQDPDTSARPYHASYRGTYRVTP
jgi:hypothetical protein